VAWWEERRGLYGRGAHGVRSAGGRMVTGADVRVAVVRGGPRGLRGDAIESGICLGERKAQGKGGAGHELEAECIYRAKKSNIGGVGLRSRPG